MELETLEQRWEGPVIVAATGASLTKAVAESCKGFPTIALKQACMRLTWADVLYACDGYHWDHYTGYPQFVGEKWSTHQVGFDDKLAAAKKYKLRLVSGKMKYDRFSEDPSVIHYGPMNSTFQAINFAIHWIKRPGRIVLVAVDFKGGFFFGRHPRTNQSTGNWDRALAGFASAAEHLPVGIEIVNGNPDSNLKCFPRMPLADALSGKSV